MLWFQWNVKDVLYITILAVLLNIKEIVNTSTVVSFGGGGGAGGLVMHDKLIIYQLQFT